MNDACLQALGSYEGGRMLYLGLGTSVGTTLISEGTIVPLALGHLQFGKASFEGRLSRQALEEHGKERWRIAVCESAATLQAAFLADYVVLGGGNAKKIKELPAGCRRSGNHNAYFGGLRMSRPPNPPRRPPWVSFQSPPLPPVVAHLDAQPKGYLYAPDASPQ